MRPWRPGRAKGVDPRTGLHLINRVPPRNADVITPALSRKNKTSTSPSSRICHLRMPRVALVTSIATTVSSPLVRQERNALVALLACVRVCCRYRRHHLVSQVSTISPWSIPKPRCYRNDNPLRFLSLWTSVPFLFFEVRQRVVARRRGAQWIVTSINVPLPTQVRAPLTRGLISRR